MKQLIKCFLFVFILLSIFISYGAVYANAGAAFYEELPSGFHIVPMKNVSVDIVHEELFFDTSLNEDPEIALIKAKYYLKSNYNTNKALSIAFPYVDYSKDTNKNSQVEDNKVQFKNIQILFDGKPIKNEVRLIPYVSPEILSGNSSSFEAILSLLNQALINGASVETDSKYENAESDELDSAFKDNGTIGVILFDLDIKAKTSHTLEVSLYQEPSSSRLEGEKAINYMYYYFLDPAKCWNSFNNLDITIRIPNDYHIEDSNLKLKNSGENLYKFHSDKLPDGNFKFTVKYNGKFLLGWKTLLIGFVLILIGIISIFVFFVYCIVRYIKRKKADKVN